MKHSKPTSFSDPSCDWMGCEEQLEAILCKSDPDLTIEDYHAIFYKFLPAADYEEGCYYLEPCFNYIAQGHDIKESRLPAGLLWWISNFRDPLEADGLLQPVRDGVIAALWQLLDRFELFDLSEQECERFGISHAYAVGPYNRETIMHFFDELTIYDLFEPDLDVVLDRLAESEAMPHVWWYMFIAFHARTWVMRWDPLSDREGQDNFVRKERVFRQLHSFEVMHRKVEALYRRSPRDPSFTKYIRLVSPPS